MLRKTPASFLRSYSIRPSKSLGQNFLNEPHLMDKLIDALELYPDEDVLEIGSGFGFMTHKIAQHALGVVAVEKDKKLLDIAKKEYGLQKNIQFVQGDFLKINLPATVKDCHLPMKMIGNIPYNISSQILFQLLDNHFLFSAGVLTLQKEVAARLTAKAGTKDYGILAILLATRIACKKIFDIEPGSFIPPPKVTSTAVRLTFLKQSPHVIHNLKLFRQVVKEAFGTRRKTIQNALKKLLKNGRIKPWETAQIDPKLRPEQIPIEGYVRLANLLNTLL
ncbi:MAG: ribosomal RNA small subunit methyltransferase A [Deltaproteobacteria bacterium]|nr:ribosomal RNA small subunit methyltransferase A [Deltaproteobacteria bacterium]